MVSNRHCRVLNGSGLPDWPGSLAPARDRKIMLFCAWRPLLVAAVKLFGVAPVRGKGRRCVLPPCHALLGGGISAPNFRSDGGKVAAPNAATLVGSDGLQRTIQYVAADLHNDLIFTGDAAKRHHVIDRDTLDR